MAKKVEYNKDLLKGADIDVDILREQRKPLLEAYDKFKSSYCFGDIIVGDKEKKDIKDWYRALLDTTAPESMLEAISNVPAKVKYFL